VLDEAAREKGEEGKGEESIIQWRSFDKVPLPMLFCDGENSRD